MKTIRLFLVAFVLLTIISCQKKEMQVSDSTQEAQGELITCSFASNDEDAKTHLGKVGIIIWDTGDEIMLFDGVSKTQKLTIASSGTPSSTVGVAAGPNFTFVKPEGWANVYAIFPYGACAEGFSAASPTINFAGQNGTFTTANISAGVAVSGVMSFKNLGAVLAIYNLNVDVQSVEVPVAELANDYQLSFSGDTPSLTSTIPATHSNVITVQNWSNATKYFGVPASTIAKGSTFVYRSSSNAIIGSYVTGSENTTVVNAIYYLPNVEEN